MRRLSVLTFAVLVLSASSLWAGTITTSFSGAGFNDGGTISGVATLEIGDGMILVDLENTSAYTKTAGQLLTGFGFAIDGFSGGTLTAASAQSADVGTTGAFTLTPGTVDLLTAKGGGATWSLDGGFFLKFNPDAKYAIIGAPHGTAPATVDPSYPFLDYSDSNGGIDGNGGHNPFSYLNAHFEISVPGIADTDAAGLRDMVIYFGTDFAGRVPPEGFPPQSFSAPLPTTAWMGLGMLALLAFARFRRRRHIAA